MSDDNVDPNSETISYTLADAQRVHDSQTANVNVDLAGLSDKGRVRPLNQDCFFIGRFERSLHALATNVPDSSIPQSHSERFYGIVVADGMGGVPAGDVASRLAVQTLVELVMSTPDWIMRASDEGFEQVMRRQQDRFNQIKQALMDYAKGHESTAGMGTTLTVAASLGLDLIIAHVGDSRAYLYRGGELRRLTRDQTFVQLLIDRGQIAPEDARYHIHKGVLMGAISATDRPIETELLRLPLSDGDCIMVCSDGLTNMVSETVIANVLKRGGPAQEDCKILLELALEAGGTDNVTVAVGRYSKIS